MMEIDVHQATPADAQIVYDITQEAFRKYAKDLQNPSVIDALKETPEDIVRAMQSKRILIGCLDDEPMGTIRYEVRGEVAYISRFGVKLMGQGCGLGRTLVQQVKMSCRVLGLKAILLHTASRMLPIVRFYYGQGFFIHSTTHDRGYIRALMVYELSRGNGLDYFQYV